MDVKIINMNENHVKEVANIEKNCFSMPWSINAFKDELKNPEAITHVAVSEKVVGFINGRKIMDEVYINNVAVDENFRRKGIAESLLTALEKSVEKDASFITLEVRETNTAAQKLYTKFGYEVVGKRRNFYSEPREDAILMTKQLGGNINENSRN